MKAMSMRWLGVVGLTMLLASCVTINVYFPAAAAEKAADTIIEEMWGDDPQSNDSSAIEPESGLSYTILVAVVEFFFPAAHAQADLDISTPEISRLTASMKARHKDLSGYYQVGAAGLSRDGLISVRDAKLVPLNERNRLKQLVASENADRNALYKEIAAANGHPEWERDIRNTFASRWIQKARPGSWYDAGSGWQQK